MVNRPTLDETFMDVARTWARRSTCQRANIGAVLARDGRTISSGYNGAPPGLPHCQHVSGEDLERCINTNHAESNTLAFAARHGVSTIGTTLYATHSPCRTCAGLLISAGIVRVVYANAYRVDGTPYSGLAWLEEAKIVVEPIGQAARV